MADGRESPQKFARVQRRVENGFVVLDWPNGKPYVLGEEITAFFERSGGSKKKFKATPNQIGKYPKLFVDPLESVEVTLSFSESPPKTPVAIWQEDGGHLGPDDAQTDSVMQEVDGSSQVKFRFSASSHQGMHRVVFHTPGGQMRILEFWVGKDQRYSPKSAA